VQIDIIDGVFADNKTVEPSVLSNIDTNLKLDFHLMVDEPINWVEKCADAGVDRIIGQIEKMSSQVEFVGKVTSAGLKVGLAIDLGTPVSKLDSLVLNNLDVVLVMSVPAGFGGQKFDRLALLRINELNEIRSRDNMSFAICDDGGITLEWIDDVRREGADEVSIGRRIFKGDLRQNLEKFRKAAYK
jgi:ribulose-phosphate 3-epimerase